MNTVIYIILITILIIILIILANYNKLIRLLNNVKKAKANIDIYLNKRFDLIPNLVECVKGYSKHEKKTLEDITKLRNNFKEQKNLDINKAAKMDNELTNFLAIVEAYPDLKANTQYMNLQKQLTSIEDEIEQTRSTYNYYVTKYNNAVETVPSNLIASIFSFKKAKLYEAEPDKKENVKVSL